MYRLTRSLHLFFIACIPLLSACSAFATPTAGPLIPGLAQTLAAQTLAAQQIWQPPSTPTQQTQPDTSVQGYGYVPSGTPQPTDTPIPQLTPFKNSPQLGASKNDIDCTNAAKFIKDITFPDNSSVKANQRFTKTWEFENVGTCTWLPDYAIVFVWGDQMNGPIARALGITVEPGQTAEISLDLVAPKEGGMYQGNWIFQDSLGKHFGTGYKARDFFWVAIEVAGRNSYLGGLCIGGG